MTLRDTQEAHGALLTAGAVMVGLGLLIAAFPNGLWFGAALVIIGAVVAVTAAVLAWKDWQRPAPPRGQAAPRDPDRFWNADKRLDALMGGSATTGLVSLAASLLFPDDPRWLIVGISAVILVLAATARFLTTQRTKTRTRRSPDDVGTTTR